LHEKETWKATCDWLKAPLLPQSPSTKKLREPSCLEECANLWSCADAERTHRAELMRRVRRKEMDMVTLVGTPEEVKASEFEIKKTVKMLDLRR